MLRIDGERERKGRLRLRVARGQSRGQNALYISRKSCQLYARSGARQINRQHISAVHSAVATR